MHKGEFHGIISDNKYIIRHIIYERKQNSKTLINMRHLTFQINIPA